MTPNLNAIDFALLARIKPANSWKKILKLKRTQAYRVLEELENVMGIPLASNLPKGMHHMTLKSFLWQTIKKIVRNALKAISSNGLRQVKKATEYVSFKPLNLKPLGFLKLSTFDQYWVWSGITQRRYHLEQAGYWA